MVSRAVAMAVMTEARTVDVKQEGLVSLAISSLVFSKVIVSGGEEVVVSGDGSVVVSGGGEVVVSGGGSVVVSGGEMMVSGGQSEPSL